MFDIEKVCRMTDELQNFVRKYEEIFLMPEVLSGEMLALFRKMNINIRAVIADNRKPISIEGSFWMNSLREEFSKVPGVNISDAPKIFSERTGIITIVKKPLPIFQTYCMIFDDQSRQLLVPTFIMSTDEILAIYDRLTMLQVLQIYSAEGFQMNSYEDTALRFARGLKTFLGKTQTFKFQLLAEYNFKFRYDLSDAAIVLQGPIAYENNYTADTIRLYRKVYPNAPIVVSTWPGESTDDFRKICRENSVALLENVPPEIAGPYNVNMQLESSLQGVKFVRENTDAKFVLKTRCDQRINKPDFLTWFRNLILTFPPLGNKLHGRILLLEAWKWRPFRTIDFLAFGYVEDIEKLYGINRKDLSPAAYRERHPLRFNKFTAPSNQCKILNHVPKKNAKFVRTINKISRRMYEVEAHILKTFYEENIGAIDFNRFLETGWRFMRDYLVIVGLSEVRLDWPKYETGANYNVNAWFSNEIDFARWLDLCRHYNSFGLE